tara:strand:+ start:241 stop:489 length:249 start_codon:yes stop_codon:yes gene_type:complete
MFSFNGSGKRKEIWERQPRKERFFGNSKAGKDNLILDIYRCMLLDMKDKGTFTNKSPIYLRYKQLLEKSIDNQITEEPNEEE